MHPTNQLIANIRHTSRALVRETGILAPTELPAAACHTLIELDLNGPLTQTEVAILVNLEKSTISRILKKLTADKLVTIKTEIADQRFKRVYLTPKGKQVVTNIHQTANTQVYSALEQLSATERDIAERGMALYTKALKLARIKTEYAIRLVQKKDNEALTLLIKKTLKEHGADRPGFAFTDPTLDNMHAAYTHPQSAYFVIERKSDGKIVGGAGISPLVDETPGICELQKMYFLTEVRGLGLGKILLQHLLAHAKSLGYTQCYLETLHTMEKANMLYKKCGFVLLKKPLGNTGHYNCDAWYLKKL